MFGMTFNPFLALLILGLISGFVVHVLVRYRLLNGLDGLLYKWIAGWIGGWVGSAIFGHWGMHIDDVYLIPAVLGAFTGSFLVVAVMKSFAAAITQAPRQETAPSQAGATPRLEMKKVS